MRISIVIPTYNRPKYLREAIESALALEGPFEKQIIVVDDGTPGPFALGLEYDEVVRCMFHGFNRGQSSCLNYALPEITGEYFTVLHDDDRVLPNKLTALVPAMEANPKWGAVSSASETIDQNGNIRHDWNERRIKRMFEKGRTPACYVNQRHGNFIQGETVLYRTEAVRTIGGWDESLPHGEECDLHLRLSCGGWRFGFVDAITAQYRIHGQNKSLFLTGKMRQSATDVGKKLRADYRPDVWVNMCSLPERVEGLRAVVEALVPNTEQAQCDRLNIGLIGYDDVPDFLDRERINAVSIYPETDRGTVEKFRWLPALREQGHGYYLTVDDDVLYPPNYVEELIQGIRSYGDAALCSFHGSVFREFPVSNYFKNRKCLHFREPQVENRRVHLIGNVCGGFHSNAFPLRPEDFAKNHNSDDSAVSIAAQRALVPAIVLAHDPDWIKSNPAVDKLGGLYDDYSKGNAEIDATINAFTGWLAEVTP